MESQGENITKSELGRFSEDVLLSLLVARADKSVWTSRPK